jgi:fibronectin-binding autotransporter adhesin
MKTRTRLLTTRLAAALALPLLAASMPTARAQITVGGNGSNTTDSAAYSGNQSLTKVGTNTVTLSGDSSYTGITTINAGTLALDKAAGAQLYKTGGHFGIAGAVTVNTGGTFQSWNWGYGSSNALSELQTNYTAFVVNGGRVVLDDTFSSDRGFTVGASGATLETTAGNTYTKLANSSEFNLIRFTANSTLTVGGAGGTVINDALGSHGNTGFSLAKTGAGTLTLGGNNTYSGSTTISGGTLQIGAGGTTGRLGSAAVTNNGALVFNRSNAMTVSNAISGNGSVTKNGVGTLTISGSNTNTGGTIVNAGTLSLAASNLLADSGSVTINSGGTFNLASNGDYIGTLAMNGNATVAGTSGLGGGQFILTQGLSGSPSLKTLTATGANNTIQTNIGISSQWGGVGGNANLRFDVVGASDSLTVSGVIADKAFDGGGTATSGAISKLGAGTFILAGNNTYTGGTTINAGTLQLASANRLADTGAVTVGGGVLSIGGFSDTVGAVTLTSGTITNGTLTGSSYAVESGTVSAVLAGSGNLNKSGSGTVTLSAANTYSGNTTVSSGILRITESGALGSGIILTSGGNLVFDRSTPTTIANTILAFGNAADSGILNNGAGLLTIQAGTNTNISFDSGDTFTVGGSGDTVIDKSIANGAANMHLTKSGIGTVTLTANANAWIGGTTISAGTLQIGNGGTSGTLGSGALMNNGTLAINRSNAVTLGDTISGTGSLVQAGSGTTSLSANNTYSGTTTISSGTLQVGTGGTSGTLGSGALTNNGTLAINRSSAVTLGAELSGTGSLAQNGSGTTTLSANNTYSGTTTISGGTLQVGAGGASGTLGSGAVTNNGALAINRSGSLTLANTISGNGSLTKNGSGTATLSGANTYTGSTTINGGTLATSGNNRLATGNSVTVNSGGTFQLGGNQTLASVAGGGTIQLGDYILNTGASNSTLSGGMAGNGGLTKSGVGTFTLSGQSSFTGDTNITGGTLVLANANALTNDAVVLMQAGTTLTLNQRTFIGALDQGGGTVNGPGELVSTLTLTSNGSLNAVLADGPDYAAGILKRTSGTTSIGAANTFTGAVKIQGGTLQLSGNGSFAAGSSLVMSAGATMDLNNKSQTFSAVTGQGGTIAMGSGSLTVNNSGTDDYNGIVTGSGSLTKQGAGTLTLGGNNTYSGGTTVSGGKLAGTTTSLKGAITNNAQVEFAQDSNGTYSSNMAGSGALIKSGTGAVTLSGSNTHSGGTTISGGKLIASTANLQGNIANNAEFELAQNTAGTYAGNISGSGALTKSGSGTVTLGGSNTYSGGTTVSGGKLAGTTANLQGNIANNAAVEFNQASNGTYLGAMSGTGTLAKTGAGNLVMSGTSTYSGATTVETGQLTVNGAIASTATVQSGASIGGSGRVGGLILESGATLTPGNSPGTLSVDGDATWNSGANYNWQVYATNTDAAVQTGAGTGWDFLDVSGTLTLSGIDSSNRFNLNLWSLSSTGPDVNGTIPGWNPNVGSTWLIASADGGIALDGNALVSNTDYSSFFSINTAATNGAGGWSGAFTDGGFQVLTLGDTNALYLRALANNDPAAVPEPGQVAASILLLAGIGVYVWRKRRKTAKPAVVPTAA